MLSIVTIVALVSVYSLIVGVSYFVRWSPIFSETEAVEAPNKKLYEKQIEATFVILTIIMTGGYSFQ